MAETNGLDRHKALETDNWQAVSRFQGHVCVSAPWMRMTNEEAVLHAAWLVAIAGATLEEFKEVLESVQNT